MLVQSVFKATELKWTASFYSTYSPYNTTELAFHLSSVRSLCTRI